MDPHPPPPGKNNSSFPYRKAKIRSSKTVGKEVGGKREKVHLRNITAAFVTLEVMM